MNLVGEFLRDIDSRWVSEGGPRMVLKVIGSTALFLQTNYLRGTKDSDVLETQEICGPVRERLIELAGRGTDIHKRHGMYLDIVGHAIPLLPADPLWHPRDLDLTHFEVHILDVTDVVVSKLVRYHGDDRADIRAMIEEHHVQQQRMLERVQSVIERYQFDARCNRLPDMVERFNQAERDWFGVTETPIELPEHIYR